MTPPPAGASTALVPALPDVGPLSSCLAGVQARLAGGDVAGGLTACHGLLLAAQGLGDHVTALHCDDLLARALLEFGDPEAAGLAATRQLALAHEVGDRHWRVRALAALATSLVERGRVVEALDPLAEAVGVVEAATARRPHHVAAHAAVSGALLRLLLVEAAAEHAEVAARAAADLLPPAAAARAARALGAVHLVWAAHLELMGRPGAGGRYVRAASAAALTQEYARRAGLASMHAAGVVVEAYALERLGDPGLAGARIRPALTGLGGTHPPEELPARLVLARSAVAAGRRHEALRELAAAERLMAAGASDGPDDDRTGTGPHGAPRGRSRAARSGASPLWSQIGAMAAADIAASLESAPEHPAVDLWRDIAASGMVAVWEAREVRWAEVRQRIMRHELARRRARTAAALRTDALTGLGNRRRLEDELTRGEPAVALFIDVDNFKRVNDVCGHPVGDGVLRQVADVLRSCCRRDDVVVRYGGDEFLVLLAAGPADHPAALALARRIVAAVRAQDWTPLTGDVPVSVSVGVAGGDDVLAALRRSDAALLAAKRAGRDTAVLA